MSCPAPGIEPGTVTHPSTKWARRRLTSLKDTNALSLRQTTNFLNTGPGTGQTATDALQLGRLILLFTLKVKLVKSKTKIN